MRIQQSAFKVKHDMGMFIGVVAFDADACNSMHAAMQAWGSDAVYVPLDAEELMHETCNGTLPVFTYTLQ